MKLDVKPGPNGIRVRCTAKDEELGAAVKALLEHLAPPILFALNNISAELAQIKHELEDQKKPEDPMRSCETAKSECDGCTGCG